MCHPFKLLLVVLVLVAVCVWGGCCCKFIGVFVGAGATLDEDAAAGSERGFHGGHYDMIAPLKITHLGL